MAEAKDDTEIAGTSRRKNRRSTSVSGDFASGFLSVQPILLPSPQCQCSRCLDSSTFQDGKSVSAEAPVLHSNATFQQNSLFNNISSPSKDEKQASFEAETEERENGYPLVADLSSMQFRRASENFIGIPTVSSSSGDQSDDAVGGILPDELGDISEDASTERCMPEYVKSLLNGASVNLDERNRQILNDLESSIGSFHTDEGSRGLNHSVPRNGRTSRHACNDFRQEKTRKSVERSFTPGPGKKILSLNRVPTLTYDIPMSPVNPLRALSGNSEYFSNRSPQKLSFERAGFCRKQLSPHSEASETRKSEESLNLWTPSFNISDCAMQLDDGWQATKGCLKDRVSFMCCKEKFADVYFTVGRGEQQKRFPAHKFILETGSVVFETMFHGELCKAEQPLLNTKINELGREEIELPDIEPSAFLALLRFLYSDDVCIGPDNVMTTLYTAKKYAVPTLEHACVDFLKRNLSTENAFMLLTQALLFDAHHLSEMCLEMIDRNTLEALSAEGFLEIDLETLCMVLGRETLRVRECPLYLAVLRWSMEQCRKRNLLVTPENQRLVLGKALYLIRFPLMTVDEFAQNAAQHGILTDREVINLFLYLTANPKPEMPFPTAPRCCVFGKEVVVSRFQRVEARWGYSGTPDRIKFTVDKRIFVLGFGLHGSIHGPHEYAVTIQVIHCGTGKVLANNDTFFTCDGSNSTFRVMFKEPIEIIPCVTYIASARLKGPDSHYGTKGLRRIVHQSPASGVVTFQFTYAAGNNNGTSVEDGQIPEIIFCTKIN